MTKRLRPVGQCFGDTRGMTVAEVIIALFVVSVGLLGLMAAMPMSTAQIAEANLKTIATFLAQQRMEQLKNARWSQTPAPPVDNLGGGGSNGGAVIGFWADEAAVASYPQFQRQVRIRDCSVATCGIAVHASLSTLRQVTITVSFARMTGLGTLNNTTLETVQLLTYVARQN